MSFKKISQKIMTVGLVAALSLVMSTDALAWGPERPTFTNHDPAEYATFNSIIDNAAVGDERDFVRIVEKNTGNKYVSDLELEAGKQYEVYIYYHNDASKTYNDAKYNYKGVARGVSVSTDFPSELAKGEVGMVSGKIKADNTEPRTVWDEAYVRAREAMTLHYVEGSAKIYNAGPVNGSVLSTKIFSEEGTLIGFSELRGMILGCDEYSGHIIYTIQTQAVDTPVAPPTEDVPDALPETGPAEVFLAVALVIVVTAGIVYFVKTHKAVSKATKKAKGRK